MEKFVAYFKKNHLLIIGVIIAAVTLYLIWRSLKGATSQSSGSQPATIDPATSTPVTTSPTSTSPQTYAPSTVTNSSYAPVTSTTTSSIYSPTSNESINNSTSDSHNIVGAVTTDSHNFTGPVTTTTTYNEQQYQLPTGLSGFSGSAGIPQNSQQPLQPASALAPTNMPITYQPIIPGSPGIPFALPSAVQARQEVQQLSQVLKQSKKPPTPITASNVNSLLPNWNAAQPIITKPGQPAHAG